MEEKSKEKVKVTRCGKTLKDGGRDLGTWVDFAIGHVKKTDSPLEPDKKATGPCGQLNFGLVKSAGF